MYTRWRGKAQVFEKQGFHRPMDSRPFRSVRPRCATKTSKTPFPKLIQSKAIYKPRVLDTLIRGFRAYGGVGRLVHKTRVLCHWAVLHLRLQRRENPSRNRDQQAPRVLRFLPIIELSPIFHTSCQARQSL